MQQAEKSHDFVQSRINPRWNREENAITFNPQICIISSSFFFFVCVRVCVCYCIAAGIIMSLGEGGTFFLIRRLGPSIILHPKNIRNIKHPKKIFEILATQTVSSQLVPKSTRT